MLFDAPNGSSAATINIADNASNYERIKIYYRGKGYQSVEVINPVGKSVSLVSAGIENGTAEIWSALATINASSISLAGNASSNGASINWNNKTLIYRIEGFNR